MAHAQLSMHGHPHILSAPRIPTYHLPLHMRCLGWAGTPCLLTACLPDPLLPREPTVDRAGLAEGKEHWYAIGVSEEAARE